MKDHPALTEARKVIDPIIGGLDNLFSRWVDEHEHEDFKDYKDKAVEMLTCSAEETGVEVENPGLATNQHGLVLSFILPKQALVRLEEQTDRLSLRVTPL